MSPYPWLDEWRNVPLSGVGSRSAPLLDPLIGLECPYYLWLGGTRELQARAWGMDVWAIEPLPLESRADQTHVQYHDPAATPERIQWFDSFNRIDPPASAIDSQWRSWELARFVVPMKSMASIDKHPTSIDSVLALDGVGNPIYSYGPQNGQRATVESLLHPTFGVGSLEWKFRLTVINMGHNGETPLRLVGSTAGLGTDLVEPWSHLSNGSDVLWAARQQILVGAAALVRLFIQLRGPTDRFLIRAGARLSGYTQAGGHLGGAMMDATRRTG